ncbi:MAG: terpene cyclase/mutase family protein, partial [Verrucomicrobiota bacterium]|nr:terpene cyclase/mutase family protein [Verrucomicrobiota bacterium]
EKPEEQVENMDIDIPVNSPNVQVESNAPNQPVSPQPQAFDAVMTVKSPVILKNIYGSTRNTGTRGVQLAKFGGDRQTEEAVLRALRWLKKNQQADGSWKSQKIAMTGLGILTFLAHGEKPGDSPEFGDTIQKAIEFLLKSQRPDGKFNGMDGNEYAHPIATYALCEAYGMTLNPNVKTAAEKALVPIINGQHPTGGWTYKMDPNAGKEDGKYRDDTSYMGWCAQALKAAKLAKVHADGLEKSIKLAVKGFQKNAHPDGGFGYTSPGKGGLTSVGSLCMQLLGASNQPEVKKALEVMDGWTPAFQNRADARALAPGEKDEAAIKKKFEPTLNPAQKAFLSGAAQYYYYYAAQCKFHQGGKHWENWNKAMKPAYVGAQQIEKGAVEDADGKKQDIGWWENMDNHSDRPTMDTCLAALQLMVYYRYLPTTSADAVKVEEEIAAVSTDTDDIKVDTGNL